jgi:hypothetical protein
MPLPVAKVMMIKTTRRAIRINLYFKVLLLIVLINNKGNIMNKQGKGVAYKRAVKVS